MKKRGVILGIFLILISMSFILAQENVSVNDSSAKVKNAYDCLKGEVTGKCSSLSSLDDKIFSLLAIGECQTEVIAASQGGLKEYWPSSTPLKTTAQAILALTRVSIDTTNAEKWLISQNISPANVDWYLQIESLEETGCKISYDGADYNININVDKKINQGAGACLKLSSDGFWLRVEPTCYGKEFKTSCDKSFQTSMVFKRQTSNILHLSGRTNPASSSGTTTEVVKSACFKGTGTGCDYEGSLWATFALKQKNYDIKPYLPYLITLAEENKRFLPEAFLYALTGSDEYRNNVLSKQKAGQYWQEADDKFYDTALALFPLSGESLQKTNTQNWLLEIQSSNGCLPTTIRNSAFLLTSLWPGTVSANVPSCTGHGFCMSTATCQTNNGSVLPGYDCGMLVCCDRDLPSRTCSDQGGSICNSDEVCAGADSTTVPASDISETYDESCCVIGTCQQKSTTTQSDCEVQGGICRYSCYDEEEEGNYVCADTLDYCCFEKKSSGSLWWIWVLIILIILALVGILFRKKIQGFIKKGSPSPGPRPGIHPMMEKRVIPRRILPPTATRPPTHAPGKQPGELDSVLKKLKELGK